MKPLIRVEKFACKQHSIKSETQMCNVLRPLSTGTAKKKNTQYGNTQLYNLYTYEAFIDSTLHWRLIA